MDVGLVCDACSALTPIGVPLCTRCGAAVALDPRPRPSSRPVAMPPATDGEAAPCHKCGTMVAGGQRFCPHCGTRIIVAVNFEVETRVGPRSSSQHAAVTTQQDPREVRDQKPGRSTLFFGGAMQAARAKLTLIRGDGDDGV